MSMSVRMLVISAAFAFAGTAFAATPQTSAAAPAAKTLSSSQQRMSDCSSAAKGKKGADYKSAVSTCMKGGSTAAATPAAAAPAAAAPMTAKQTQQEKMKSCNAQAKTQAPTGAAHKTFMSSCLKGSAAAAATP
ncbi:PsiF family protein [Rhodanobacter sp. C01]|uniref:PsiF family protein n=1 Tax=Rhodanobacter sp. C01 TaxID=1945856 RepID=UPI0009877E30|nr:PsiF family protein [Rhodanobacter sp. C01]OOG45778.1 phosphate starvation-inducible protein PsiF [Rhodanobacter sp. C01]